MACKRIYRQKHPHVRGEDTIQRNRTKSTAETPPRAWGRLLPCPHCRRQGGNTPTCVGKTLLPFPSLRSLRKHPHVRGEDLPCFRWSTLKRETPPRAWGRRTTEALEALKKGNTPTCVGKTFFYCRYGRDVWKHPHVRGEDRSRQNPLRCVTETPPRAWGRQPLGDASWVTLRNTPTCVGKTGRTMNCREALRNTPTCVGKTLRDYSLFLLSRQNNIETSSFSDTSCSPDNSMSWRFGSPMP